MTPSDPLFPPQTEDALRDLVRAFAAQGRAIHPAGSGTKARHGPRAAEGAVTVSLRKLDRITQYEPGDLVVTVQAGVRLADLQAELAKRGQWLPLDPPYADATVGGILATNSSGPRRLAYGTARDMLLGLRVVGADGVATKSGGRVVKNVTGYDLHKLHIGAFGTLGILTEASFKVRPLPEVSALIVIPYATFEEAYTALLKIHASNLRPAALEALDAGASRRLLDAVGMNVSDAVDAMRGVLQEKRANDAAGPDEDALRKAAALAILPSLQEGAGALALVGVEGTHAVLTRHCKDVKRLLTAEGGTAPAFTVCSCDFSSGGLWKGLRDLPTLLKDRVRVRIGAKPHDLPGLVGANSDSPLPVRGRWVRAGTGLAWLDLEPAADLPERIAAWHAKAAAVGGYAVAESAPLDLPGRERLPWSTPGDPAARAIERAIRQAWDPAGVLCPGRAPA